jgi:hypothetical protein
MKAKQLSKKEQQELAEAFQSITARKDLVNSFPKEVLANFIAEEGFDAFCVWKMRRPEGKKS